MSLNTFYLSPIRSNNVKYYVDLFMKAGFGNAEKAVVVIAKPYYKFSDRNPFGIEKTKELLSIVNDFMVTDKLIKSSFAIIELDEPKTHEVSEWRNRLRQFSDGGVLSFSCPKDYEIYTNLFPANFIETEVAEYVYPIESLLDPMLVGYLEGCLYADKKTYPAAIPTVDVALLVKNSQNQTCIVLGKKPNDDRLHFPGGFVDPTDESYEHAAVRELLEETSINLLSSDIEYVGSERIMDWRYSKLKHKIITHLYVCDLTDYSMRIPNDFIIRQLKASDDLVSLEVVPLQLADKSNITDHHRGLLEKVKNYYKNKHEKF